MKIRQEFSSFFILSLPFGGLSTWKFIFIVSFFLTLMMLACFCYKNVVVMFFFILCLCSYWLANLCSITGVNVPVVMLVVEGGVNTMTTVSQAIEQNIPVLVLNGSGRAADFISVGYTKSMDTREYVQLLFVLLRFSFLINQNSTIVLHQKIIKMCILFPEFICS